MQSQSSKLVTKENVLKKIVFISYNSYPPCYSGKLIISWKRFKDLDPKKFEVLIFTSGLKGESQDEKVGNIHIRRSPYIGGGKITGRLNVVSFWLWSLFMFLKEPEVSAVHFDEIGYFSIPVFKRLGYRLAYSHFTTLAKIARIKSSRRIFEHAISDSRGHFAPDPIKRHFLDHMSEVVCVSEALYQAALEVFPKKAQKIVYGVEDQVFTPINSLEKSQARHSNGALPEDIIFCFVGLVVRRKGIDLICQAFPRVLREYPQSKLWIIGPKSHAESRHIHDDEVAEYQHLLEPVKERVQFFGNIIDRTELAKILASTDVFLFPTRQEGFGLAPVEAMACAVPPIIARIPGVTDLANVEGVTGLYITPDSEQELEFAMKQLASDKRLRESMGKAARIKVKEEFSWKGHVAEWVKLYEQN